MRLMLSSIGLCALLALSCAQPFTYQGFLKASGSPANGAYTMTFRLFSVPSGGVAIATVGPVSVSVSNGLFTQVLNFGSVWDGSDRYLEIQVGSTVLSPRVKINPTPYAAYAYAAPPVGSAGGDLSGSYPNPSVVRLQARPVSSTAPASGQVLKWTGTMWAPAPDDGLTLPFIGSANVSGAVFSITNTATSGATYGVSGVSLSTDGRGVVGYATATSGFAYGVYGQSDSTSGRGVVGYADATSGFTYGVYGLSNSTDGRGVVGIANASTGTNYGVYGLSRSTDGTGVYGYANASSGVTYGVWGSSESTSGTGVYGNASATSGDTSGVYGLSRSTSGTGVYGNANATSGVTSGVYGKSESTDGRGVYGYANASTGANYGVYGLSRSTDGTGVYGYANATSGVTYGVWGSSDSTSGRGVFGYASATSGPTYGVYGLSQSTVGTGVYGIADATSGSAWGVWGSTNSSASSAYGVSGYEPSGGSGHAVYAFGTLAATGTKSFQIDHPLRPETHYLNHFCAEAPEPMNFYSGNVVTDAQGYAVVQLPDYFETINRDFRYQLTVIDGAGEDFVQVRVVRKIQNNQFTIRTSKPYVEVSWRVETIRNDLYVQRYGFQTEQEKEDDIKGKYLHPELYGQSKEQGIHYRPEPERPNEVEKPK